MQHKPFFFSILLFTMLMHVHCQKECLPLDKIDSLFKDYLSTNQVKNSGFILGVSCEKSHRYYSYGFLDIKNKPDSLSIFEIGSISKTFTGVLLADSFLKNEISFNKSIMDYLPKYVGSNQNIKKITLLQLINHSSGLPKMSSALNLNHNNFDPYKTISAKHLYNDLRVEEDLKTPGQTYIYSNFGYAILGLILEKKSKKKYFKNLESVLFEPLNMDSTFENVPSNKINKYIIGINSNGKQANHWMFNGMTPAGGLNSSARDLLNFLDAQTQGDNLRLNKLLEITQMPSIDLDDSTQIGMGWFVKINKSSEKIYYNLGNTNGFSSLIIFNKFNGAGLVILSNSANSYNFLLNFLNFYITNL